MSPPPPHTHILLPSSAAWLLSDPPGTARNLELSQHLPSLINTYFPKHLLCAKHREIVKKKTGKIPALESRVEVIINVNETKEKWEVSQEGG